MQAEITEFFQEENQPSGAEDLLLIREKVSQAIRRSGLSQAELADAGGLEQSQISRWLAAERGFPLYALLRLAPHLGLDWQELLEHRGGIAMLPETLDRLPAGLVPLGISEPYTLALPLDQIGGATLVAGEHRLGPRREILLELALSLAQQNQPIIFAHRDAHLLERFCTELARRAPWLLGQIIALDPARQPLPINPLSGKNALGDLLYLLRSSDRELRKRLSFLIESGKTLLEISRDLQEDFPEEADLLFELDLFSTEKNRTSEILRENIVLLHLEGESVLPLFALELSRTGEGRFCLLDDIEKNQEPVDLLLEQDHLSLVLGAESAEQVADISGQCRYCIHSSSGQGLWHQEEIHSPALESREDLFFFRHKKMPRTLPGSELYLEQAQKYHTWWSSGLRRKTPVYSSAEEARRSLREVFLAS